MIRRSPSIIAVLLAVLLGSIVVIPAGTLDLNNAVVVTPANLSGPEKKAVAMLLDEVQKRTQIRWPTAFDSPAPGRTVIAVRQASEPGSPEGYGIRVQNAPDPQAVL